MSQTSEILDHDVVVIGAGAAGIAAGLRLAQSQLRFLIIEGRSRMGGRAATMIVGGYPLDLGCGWLHSADRNPWTVRLAESGFSIDKTPPGWQGQSLDLGFSPQDQEAFGEAWGAFYARLAAAEDEPHDKPAACLLEPGGRFNALLNAISTYVSGVELERLSMRDMLRYADSDVNWRVVEGYGAGIVAQATDARRRALPVKLGCHVSRIDHSGPDLRIVTSSGTLRARVVIVTVPPNLLLLEKLVFDPPLPEKSAAAEGLPLGLADKLFLRIDEPDFLPKDGHLIGRTDRVATAGYQLRPFGRDLIEAYFGGSLARTLENAGEAGFFAFACDELANLFGSEIRCRLHPLVHTSWGEDPYACGAYSYAVPGQADARAKLAAAVEDRIYFAGEACSTQDFSTAHGAYLTGTKAAEDAVATLAGRSASG
jgi:monoamine oxidase